MPVIQAKQTVSVALRLLSDSLPAGVYSGSLLLAADGGDGTKTIELRVERSSRTRWVVGAVLIALGIAVSWLMTAYLRQAAGRSAALLPAARIVDVIRTLRARIDDATRVTTEQLPGLRAQLELSEANLSDAELERRGFIPRRIPNPFATQPDLANAYAQYLNDQSARVTALAVLIRDGVGGAVAEWAGAANRIPITTALRALDAAAPATSDPQAAVAIVQATLSAMQTALGIQAPAGITNGVLATARQLDLQLQRVSLAAWGVWFIVTLVVGVVAILLTNYGFGTPLDYAKAFLWGLGVPLAGQQLQQLGQTTASSTFNLVMPK